MPGLLREEDEGSEHGGKVLLRDVIEENNKRGYNDFGNKKKEMIKGTTKGDTTYDFGN